MNSTEYGKAEIIWHMNLPNSGKSD